MSNRRHGIGPPANEIEDVQTIGEGRDGVAGQKGEREGEGENDSTETDKEDWARCAIDYMEIS
jgi:hypothetical protein